MQPCRVPQAVGLWYTQEHTAAASAGARRALGQAGLNLDGRAPVPFARCAACARAAGGSNTGRGGDTRGGWARAGAAPRRPRRPTGKQVRHEKKCGTHRAAAPARPGDAPGRPASCPLCRAPATPAAARRSRTRRSPRPPPTARWPGCRGSMGRSARRSAPSAGWSASARARAASRQRAPRRRGRRPRVAQAGGPEAAPRRRACV